MRTVQESLVLAEEEAGKRFPDGEYTVKLISWCDGDYTVNVRHGIGSLDSGNELVEIIRITPHQAKYELKEITQCERSIRHKQGDL